MAEKITMKVDNNVHQKLQIVKGLMGTKTLSETIQVLAEEHIEKIMGKVKKG